MSFLEIWDIYGLEGQVINDGSVVSSLMEQAKRLPA
jgi:hypothetical protein